MCYTIHEAYMNVVITQWAFDSYLDLKHQNVFDQIEFNNRIQPDVRLLTAYPKDPKFTNGKFWSPANDRNSKVIGDGFKMKWHQVGSGKVQLRLPVAIINQPILCEAYVKSDDKKDRRMMARFKTHIQLIRQGNFKTSGIIK